MWKNRETLLLAFLLSVAVWVSAVIASDPNREDFIQGGVELDVIGLGDTLILSSSPPKTVDVQIRAPESLWLEIEENPELVRAFIDFSSVEKGEQTLPVQVTVGVTPAEVIDVNPPSVSVIIEEEITVQMMPTVNLIGDPAEGFEVQEEGIEINNNEPVTVTGPESRMKLVAGVEANISVLDSRENISTVTNLIAVDESGRQISGVTLDPNQVNVTVPIIQSGGYRDVAVRVETTGQPASGYTVVNIEVEPPTITVYSPEANLVESISGVVSTQPLDLTDVSTDLDIRLGVVLPEGVTMVGTEQSVRVRIGVSAIESSMTISVPVNVLELGTGLFATLSPTNVDVFLTGPAQVME
ncbi:MAG TPA: CdaR family protein, partial [Anaerolineales bacterium]|nr:CdaR family protein [Anaerolineales bacterium]